LQASKKKKKTKTNGDEEIKKNKEVTLTIILKSHLFPTRFNNIILYIMNFKLKNNIIYK